jgi:trehalose 6-phosphate synthase
MAMTPPENDLVWLERARRPDLALLLDLDGTLIPFAPTLELATLDEPGVSLLRALRDSGVNVAIVSGRPKPALEPHRQRVADAWWVAEHGIWSHFGDAWSAADGTAAPDLDLLYNALRTLEEVPGLRLERKSLSVCAHWRQVAPAMRDAVIAAIELVSEEWLETQPEYERLDGAEMFEVRKRSAHKGTAVKAVRLRLPAASFIAIGDDDTDEDMFAALSTEDVAIAVRNGRRRTTRAHYSLPDPGAVREFLWWLVDARTRQGLLPLPRFDAPPAPLPPARSQLVVVSNRLPALPTAARERQVGGLVSALEPALREHEGIWLGWSGHTRDGDPVLAVDDEAVPRRASFDFSPEWRERFYGGFCNRALWPLLHGFPGRVRYLDQDWVAYQEVNRSFAASAAALAVDGGTIWVHDYHLMLVARDLRDLGFTGKTGIFMHVPFPQPDVFETLPWCDELLSALYRFDLVGFHTAQWADNFRACAAAHGRRIGKAPQLPHVAILPIGIDSVGFRGGPAEIDRDVAGLMKTLGERRMILGVDRLDYSKGIPERLTAFEHLLENYPEWRGHVSFVQISVPSREDIPEYAELRQRVELQVGRINGKFGEADWVPVRYLYRSYDHGVLAQLYRAADVALVTPLRDGLNLVAKEFVASQDPARPGVLVLSRFAGAAAELSDAVITNPYHPDGVAAHIHSALQMPLEERVRRQALLSAVVSATTPVSWATGFLGHLRGTRAILGSAVPTTDLTAKGSSPPIASGTSQ